MYDLTSRGFLRRYLLPRTYEEAQDYLQARFHTLSLLSVFHHSFPGEFLSAWRSDQAVLLPQEDQLYSRAELECLRLIEDRLFPFALEHLLMCADDGERLNTVPLYAHGIDLWYRGLSDYEPGWQVLILLFEPGILENLDEGEQQEIGAERLAILRQASRESLDGALDECAQRCRQEGAPLDALPIAYRMLRHETGNVYLDATDDEPCEGMCWDVAAIELLATQWKEAQTMDEQVNALGKWLVADVTHLKKAVALWNG